MEFKCLGFLPLFAILLATATSASTREEKSKECKDRKPFADPEDCTKYYRCMKINRKWVALHRKCKEGKYYDAENNVCVEGKCPTMSNFVTEK